MNNPADGGMSDWPAQPSVTASTADIVSGGVYAVTLLAVPGVDEGGLKNVQWVAALLVPVGTGGEAVERLYGRGPTPASAYADLDIQLQEAVR